MSNQDGVKERSNSAKERSRIGTSDSQALLRNDCPKCLGRSEEKPCIEWVDILRNEFTDYINELFRKKMQEFIDFIEEYVNVED